MEVIFVFIFGSILGSFFNVLLFRKNTGEPFVFKGSRCFSCGKKLNPPDLIPILSFIMLRGRCRYCGSKISIQYPIVEILVGALAVVIYFKIFPDASFIFFNKEVGIPTLHRDNFQIPDLLLVISYLSFIYYFFAFSALFLVAAYDFRAKIIDTHFLGIFGFFSVAEFLIRNSPAGQAGWTAGVWIYDLISSFLIALFFYLIWRLSGGRWMGRGDANLAFFTSVFLGWPLNLAALFLSFWTGAVVGAILLLHRKFNLKSEIPFGPFLALGAMLAWYFAGAIEGFYGTIW